MVDRRHISRRTFAGMAGAAAVAGPPLVAQGRQATPAASPATGFRTVADVLGNTVEIPADPQRVVVLDVNLLGLALALGIKPVAASRYGTADAFPKILGEDTDGIVALGKNETLDVESVVALDPDLIVMTYYGDPTTYDLVKHIAPTVLSGEFRDGWRDDSMIAADAMNRLDALQTVSDAYDARVQEIVAALPEQFRDTETAVLRFTKEAIRLQKRNACISSILADHTLQVPDVDAGSNGIATDLSIENIRDVDFPTLWIVSDGNADADASVAEFFKSDLVKGLQSVQNQTIYFVPQEYWITLRGYMAARYVQDDLQRYLIDGEPSPAFPS
ncbi:MAG: ABC transporter substrate-binding protein [Thermomicrobiales bacterium]